MQPEIQVLSNVIERLKNVPTEATGRLYGITHNDTLTIITFSIDYNSDDVFDFLSFESCLPANVDHCGLLYIGDTHRQNLPCDLNINRVILRYLPDIKKTEWFLCHDNFLHDENKLSDVKIINENQFEEQFAYVRIQLGMPLIGEKNQILEMLKDIYARITSGKVAFYFPSKKIYLLHNDKDDDVENTKVKELLNFPKATGGSVHSINAINANASIQISKQESYGVCEHAPVLHQKKYAFDSIEYTFNIDRLILIDRRAISLKLHQTLVAAIYQYIDVIIALWKTKFPVCVDYKIPLEWFYFKPQKLGHVLTVPYINGWDDDKMTPCIKRLHITLGFDLTRPYFRRTNSVQFSNDLQNNHLIINPHESVPSIKDGKTSIVYGLYSYHHYMQNDFDDNGWGCAYRSLQTIVSWFRLQGYTNIPIPSHRDIQKCLVDISDKPPKIIGSKEWIGSTEVGFVLETLLGIDVTLLVASSGDEISNFASSIANHFDTQGTPIMIGGGVLAHTILGINYNESTGEVKLLILDPHYTGSDKLSTIINKGYCGWKSEDFWRKDSFYNMCLPQRPIRI